MPLMTVGQGVLRFKLLLDGRPTLVTAYAGLPLIIEAQRAVVPKSLYRKLRDALGYESWQVVRRHLESLVALIAAGGDCLDDLRTLRADAGLCALLGFVPSSPTQAKDFLYRFHQHPSGRPWTEEEDQELSHPGAAHIREEGPGLTWLQEMVRRPVEELQRQAPRLRATLDVDATIIEAHKEEALRAYEGTVGYQPQMAYWAEQGVYVLDQFRDGNVNAEHRIKEFVQQAVRSIARVAGLPLRLRGDSALYHEALLTWAADEQKLEFAVSADMSEALRKKVEAIPESEWKPYRTLREQEKELSEERQWAEVVDFIPSWARNVKKGTEPLRYLAIRVRSRQKELWEGRGSGWLHFAVVTNMTWEGEHLLRWQREKQGTVEQAHDVLKNELAAGTLPCGRFGANAAFLRINVLTHNLLQLTKAVALPEHMASMRPKALRFHLLRIAGQVVRSGRQLFLKITAALPIAPLYAEARKTFQNLLRADADAQGGIPCPSG